MNVSTRNNTKDQHYEFASGLLLKNAIIKAFSVLCLTLLLMVCIKNDAKAQAEFIDMQGNVLEEGESVHPDDSLALVAFYNALDGPNWLNNAGWLEDMVEFWHGIERVEEIDDDVWRVTRIEIQNNFLQGEMPDDIGLMVHLERFGLADNYIHGSIPETIGDMESLERLDFRRNIFSGVPPWDALISLPNLERIHINGNFHEGDIPSAFGNFPRLEHIEMYSNNFTGQIPPEMGNVETMTRLRMGDAWFTGDIPDEIGNLPDLQRVTFRGLPFINEGPFPAWLQDMADHIERIEITDANLTGEIPEWINDLYLLERLHLGGDQDQIGGDIPNMTFLTNLDWLELSGGNFTGPIPDWLGQMPALERLTLNDNNITGPIPSSLANAPELERIDFRNLQLDGPMPDLRNLNLDRLELENIGFDIGPIPEWVGTQGRLDRIEMTNTGVSGDIPEFLSQLEALARFEFADNPDLTGDVPSWLQNMDNLARLDLTRTSVDVGDEVPVWLANKSQLERLSLGGLGLTGGIPDWLGNHVRLEHLVLDGNELTGAIPATLGNLVLLDSLNLANNQLTGEIPPALADAGRIGPVTLMSRIDLSGNEGLSGPVPIEFTNWDAEVMRVFHFDGTGLCEPDDGSFGAWLEGIDNHMDPNIHTSVRSTGVVCGEPTDSEYMGRPYIFALHQSYPNPFNPATTIRYEVPADEHVTLRVYDILGKHVATLVNEDHSPGSYEINFDGTRLASGTYIYRLQAGNRSQTQTMMLIK